MKDFLKCAGIRALKTVCQTAVAMIGAATVLSSVDWKVVLSSSLLSGVLSILTSLAGIPEVNKNGICEEEVQTEDSEE